MSPGRYAQGTEVTVDRSQQEIVRILHRYDVETYAFGASKGQVALSFELNDMPIRITLPVPPKPAADDKYKAANGKWVSRLPAWEQEVKEAWRALALVLKANLEMVDRELTTVQQAFMAYLVAADGRTVGEIVLPQYIEARGQLALEAGS